MAQHGGYRKPAHPAAVSPPGALSQRTDGGPTVGAIDQLSSGKYGETQALNGVAAAAPVSAPHQGNQALASAIDQGGIGFGNPTTQPGVPVTSGSQYGPGPGPEALQANDPIRAEAQKLAQSGTLAVMMHVADSDEASDSFRAYVRQLIASLS